MHLILTGATGLVGSAALHALIRTQSITKISILARSPVPQATDSPLAKQKCTVFKHPDFSVPPTEDTLSQLKDARGCIWALGISQNDVDAKKYEQITYEYTMVFARAFAAAEVGDRGVFNFVYVSGEGATLNPGRFTPIFGRVKGRTEAALLEFSKQHAGSSFQVFSARPAGVDRIDQPEIAPYMDARPQGFAKKLEKPLLAMIRPVMKSMISPTKELGDALVMLASGDGEPMADGSGVSGEGRTLGNIALRRMVGI